MPKVEITREKIVEVLESKKPVSLTEVYRHLGGAGKLSGTVAGKMRSLVEGIDALVANNKAGAGTAKSAPVPTTGKEKFRTSKRSGRTVYVRHSKNPFREGSNYALAFDILASFPDGLPLAEWRERYSKAARTSLKLAGYGIQVLLTAKDTPTGERHRSCRDGFYIEREGDHVALKF